MPAILRTFTLRLVVHLARQSKNIVTIENELLRMLGSLGAVVAWFVPGRVAVLLEGEAKPISFKLMNLRLA